MKQRDMYSSGSGSRVLATACKIRAICEGQDSVPDQACSQLSRVATVQYLKKLDNILEKNQNPYQVRAAVGKQRNRTDEA